MFSEAFYRNTDNQLQGPRPAVRAKEAESALTYLLLLRSSIGLSLVTLSTLSTLRILQPQQQNKSPPEFSLYPPPKGPRLQSSPRTLATILVVSVGFSTLRTYKASKTVSSPLL